MPIQDAQKNSTITQNKFEEFWNSTKIFNIRYVVYPKKVPNTNCCCYLICFLSDTLQTRPLLICNSCTVVYVSFFSSCNNELFVLRTNLCETTMHGVVRTQSHSTLHKTHVSYLPFQMYCFCSPPVIRSLWTVDSQLSVPLALSRQGTRPSRSNHQIIRTRNAWW